MISPDDIELLHLTDDPEEADAARGRCYDRRCAQSGRGRQEDVR